MRGTTTLAAAAAAAVLLGASVLLGVGTDQTTDASASASTNASTGATGTRTALKGPVATVTPFPVHRRPPSASPPQTSPSSTGPSSSTRRLPPRAARMDYQLGGAYPNPGVRVFARDRLEAPAADAYNICYLNGFQTQASETAWWLANHPDLVLRDATGSIVMDDGWNEALLDLRADAKRRAVLAVVVGWIQACADDGFDAVEFDNQDSYSRSRGLMTFEHDFAHMALLTAAAHTRGLAVAQKNAVSEYGTRGRDQLGLDFVVSEECSVWNECAAYNDVYGSMHLQIEYTDQPLAGFTASCAAWRTHHSIIRRDRALAAAGRPGHSYTSCQ